MPKLIQINIPDDLNDRIKKYMYKENITNKEKAMLRIIEDRLPEEEKGEEELMEAKTR